MYSVVSVDFVFVFSIIMSSNHQLMTSPINLSLISDGASWCNIGGVLSQLRRDGILCDVKLIGSDFASTNVIVTAHILILASSCHYFYSLYITNHTTLTADQLLEITAIDTHTLQVFINFIYGHNPSDLAELEMLKTAADILGVPSATVYLDSIGQVLMKDDEMLQESGDDETDDTEKDADYNPVLDVPTRSKSSTGTRTSATRKKKQITMYCCPLCNHVCRYQKLLSEHLRIKHVFPSTICTVCSVDVKDESIINHLLSKHIKDKVMNTSIARKLKGKKKPLKKRIKSTYVERRASGFDCDVCLDKFNDKAILNLHLIEKHKYFRCEICERPFPSKDGALNHIAKYHSQTLQCCHCKCKYENCLEMVTHLFTQHTEERNFVCCICGRNSTQHIYAVNHFLENHEIQATYAEIRGLNAIVTPFNLKIFTDLVQHIDGTSKDKDLAQTWLLKSFPCYYCGTRFKSKNELIYDIKKHLLEDKQHLLSLDQNEYECMDCDETFVDQKLALKHKYSVHSNKFICKVCNRRQLSASALALHMNIHLKQRPFICEVCGKGFKQPNALKDHMTTHSDSHNFTCKECYKTFKYRQSLNGHMKRVHDPSYVRRYACELCDFKAHSKTALQTHLLSHTGERHFLCTQCDKSFLTLAHYRRHCKTVHNFDEATRQQVPAIQQSQTLIPVPNRNLLEHGGSVIEHNEHLQMPVLTQQLQSHSSTNLQMTYVQPTLLEHNNMNYVQVMDQHTSLPTHTTTLHSASHQTALSVPHQTSVQQPLPSQPSIQTHQAQSLHQSQPPHQSQSSNQPQHLQPLHQAQTHRNVQEWQ